MIVNLKVTRLSSIIEPNDSKYKENTLVMHFTDHFKCVKNESEKLL